MATERRPLIDRSTEPFDFFFLGGEETKIEELGFRPVVVDTNEKWIERRVSLEKVSPPSSSSLVFSPKFTLDAKRIKRRKNKKEREQTITRLVAVVVVGES